MLRVKATTIGAALVLLLSHGTTATPTAAPTELEFLIQTTVAGPNEMFGGSGSITPAPTASTTSTRAPTTPPLSSVSCAEVQTRGSTTDGEYMLFLEGVFVSVFCYKMGPNVNDSSAPYAFITLSTANRAQWVRDCATTTTTFTKLRLNETTMRMYTSDCEWWCLFWDCMTSSHAVCCPRETPQGSEMGRGVESRCLLVGLSPWCMM
jgi:hypothetical protein